MYLGIVWGRKWPFEYSEDALETSSFKWDALIAIGFMIHRDDLDSVWLVVESKE